MGQPPPQHGLEVERRQQREVAVPRTLQVSRQRSGRAVLETLHPARHELAAEVAGGVDDVQLGVPAERLEVLAAASSSARTNASWLATAVPSWAATAATSRSQ